MLSWTLFYTALFDMDKSPMVDVIDPDGLVRSQVVESEGRGFCVSLNGAETHRTLAGDFLAQSFGASVQHIALATDDIFATTEALKTCGFDPLPLSENYYADLAARFDLAPGLLERLKAANVFYDELNGSPFFSFIPAALQVACSLRSCSASRAMAATAPPMRPLELPRKKRLARPKGMPAMKG